MTLPALAALLAIAAGPSVASEERRVERVDHALAGTDGNVGYIVKQIGGDVLAARGTDLVFEPASAIKVLHHLHALLAVQAGSARLDEPIRVVTSGATCVTDPFDPEGAPLDTGGVPVDDGAARDVLATAREQHTSEEPLETALAWMMRVSDNGRTYAVKKRFGRDAINETARSIGMTDTRLRHEIGCNGVPLPEDVPYLNDVSTPAGVDIDEGETVKFTTKVHHPNQMTLDDIALLYERAFDGSLLHDAEMRQKMWSLMSGSENSTRTTGTTNVDWLDGLIMEEARESFGDAPVPETFWRGVRLVQKDGSYSANFGPAAHCRGTFPDRCYAVTMTRHTRTLAGWIELPHRSNGKPGALTTEAYAWGIFVDGATNHQAAARARDTALRELLRLQVRESLGTFLNGGQRRSSAS